MASLTQLVAKLTPALKTALENAVGEAVKRRTPAVEPEHWLYHAIFGGDGALAATLEGLGCDLPTLQVELDRAMPRGSAQVDQPTLSGSLTKLLETAWMIASVEIDRDRIGGEALVLACQSRNAMGARTVPVRALDPVSTDALRAAAAAAAGLGPRAGAAADAGAAAGGALERFTVDLTARARAGGIDPVLGRTEEIAKAIDVLLRKRQNNPILLGEPGVGKTAIAEGLALKVVEGAVPPQLRDVALVALDMALLQAGASVKGEFEERLKNVLREAKASPRPIIVFIDEAHTMIGAGGAEGQNDAANLLKPALARGEFRTIAATTFAEYKRYFEKDPALSRRFQPISVEEPAADAATHILRHVGAGLAEHHGVLLREEAIRAAVDLTVRFMPARRLPDKAISVLDTACARVALSQAARPKVIERLEEELAFARSELDSARRDARLFDEAEHDGAAQEAVLTRLDADLAERTGHWEAQKRQVEARLATARAALDAVAADPAAPDAGAETYVHPWVSAATVAEVIADWTGVPVSSLTGSEAQRILSLDTALKARVIGQDHAVEAIARSLKISRAGLTDTRKPIGVFLLCGPSGTGKTETALALAAEMFGGEEAVTTINMTEFKEAQKTAMLLGAAAGYVGYGKGGVLTEAVRRRPYQVLLLDEMEKAHPEIQEVFFQIFDKGRISDSEGVSVDFRNTVIIMTSNTGGEALRQHLDNDPGADAGALQRLLRPHLLERFSPAFLGRTEIIAYRPLGAQVSGRIVEIHLARIRDRLRAQYGADFDWEGSFVEHVVKANGDPLSGGRALEAIMTRTLLPRLAETCIGRITQERPFSRIAVGWTDELTLEVS